MAGGEEVVEFLGVIVEEFFVAFRDFHEPVEGGTESDDFAPSLEAGFEDGVDVVGVAGGGEVEGGFVDVVDHAAANEAGAELGE